MHEKMEKVSTLKMSEPEQTKSPDFSGKTY